MTSIKLLKINDPFQKDFLGIVDEKTVDTWNKRYRFLMSKKRAFEVATLNTHEMPTIHERRFIMSSRPKIFRWGTSLTPTMDEFNLASILLMRNKLLYNKHTKDFQEKAKK